jgi:hypothetical protein
MKQLVALARVSSREQEREGFSLEVQEEAMRRYATQAGGEIAKLFGIAETAMNARRSVNCSPTPKRIWDSLRKNNPPVNSFSLRLLTAS